MAAFRIVDPFVTYFNNAGEPLADGSLEFYETGTTTPADTFADKDLSVNNGPIITLNSAGRADLDIWGGATVDSYRMRVKDSLGNQIGPDRDDLEIYGTGGLTLPSVTGQTGKFLTTNGIAWLLEAIRQLPDMTGQSGKVLGTDGTNALWQAVAALPDFPADGIETGTKLIRVGDFQLLAGVETLPASGTHTASKVVTFATPFNAAPYYVGCTNTTGGVSPSGAQGTITAQGQSASGFTINLDVNIDSVDAGWNISVGAVVQWFAFGPVTP